MASGTAESRGSNNNQPGSLLFCSSLQFPLCCGFILSQSFSLQYERWLMMTTSFSLLSTTQDWKGKGATFFPLSIPVTHFTLLMEKITYPNPNSALNITRGWRILTCQPEASGHLDWQTGTDYVYLESLLRRRHAEQAQVSSVTKKGEWLLTYRELFSREKWTKRK